jgi:glycosyltransferase involved in cell wall biosynthesis
MPLDPAYGDELVGLAAELGVADQVRFLGRRQDVGAILAAGDVFAMPSHDEPFGLVFVEAMAMARAVVAVADGGTLEVVEHGRSGLLSPWGDDAQLAANLGLLLRDGEQRDSMGTYGRHRAAERFTVQRMAADVARAYRLIAS